MRTERSKGGQEAGTHAPTIVRRWGRGRSWLVATIVALVACDSPAAPGAGGEAVLIELTPEEMQLEVGDTVRVQAMPVDENGRPLLGREVRWVVGHSSVVEVSATGLVRAKQAGNTFVRAIAGYAVGTALVAVIDPDAPLPVITALEPSSVVAGSDAVTLVVRGQRFGEGSEILLGGDLAGTTRIGDTELRTRVDAEALADAGTIEVRVTRYGSESAPAVFTIVPAGGNGGGGSAPPLSALSPGSVPAGSLAFTLRVTGTGFSEGARIRWNGTDLDTHWAGPTELYTRIQPVAVWYAGPVEIRVVDGSDASARVSPPLTFTVAPSGVQAVQVSPTSLTMDPGDSETLQVRLLDASGAELTGRYMSFHSANANYAEVLGDGEVRALREGTTRIRVSSSDRFVEIPVTVAPAPVNRLSVTPSAPVIATSTQVQLTARTFVAGGEEVFGREIQWWSADPAVASASAEGVVTGRSKGTVAIWAESEGRSESAEVEVRELPTTPAWTFDLRLDPLTVLPAVGDTTWVDGGGGTHVARFYMTEASVVLNRETSRWQQRMVWELREGATLLGGVVRELEGAIGLDWATLDYALLSDDVPPVTLATGQLDDLGTLRLRQAVGTAPAMDWVYVVR